MIKHTFLLPRSLELRSLTYHNHIKRRKIKRVLKLSKSCVFSEIKTAPYYKDYLRFFSSPTTSSSSSTTTVSTVTDRKIDNQSDEQQRSTIPTSAVETSNSFKVDTVPEDNHHRSDQEESKYNDDTIHERQIRKRNIKQLLQSAWSDYKSTWEGFFDNLKMEKKDTNSAQEEEENAKEKDLIDLEKIQDKQKELRANVNRNLKTIRQEGGTIMEVIKETTGLRNKRDLKIWAMEQLKLANECVAEFMKGYRAGRDEEMDKMMNEYFKDIDLDFQQQQQEREKGVVDEKTSTTNNDNKGASTIENPTKPGRIRRRRKAQI